MSRRGSFTGESSGAREERLVESLGDGAHRAGHRLAGVKNLQRTLASIGLPVKVTGVVDDPTVEALNGIFSEWDDAPASLRGGKLTAAAVANNLPTITAYVRRAAGGAKNFGDATKEG